MKVAIIDDLKNNIDDSHVRWYLSSQEIWIGHERNYEEIEESIGKSYGSFKWLFSEADTILFDKKNLMFTSSVIKVNEPISLIEGKFEVINRRKGTIKLVEASNFNCELGDRTTYYSDEDILVSAKNTLKLGDEIIELGITNDFSFIVKGDELVGCILKNSSRHLIVDRINCIDSQFQSTDFIKTTLINYLKLIEKLDEELTSDEEEKLMNDFKVLYEGIVTCTMEPVIAIKESILNVLDFM
jgi:hypothetical protein